MRYLPINIELFVHNRKNFIAKMKENSVVIFNSNDEMFRSGDQFFLFRQNSDLFYLTGIEQEQTILILAPDHPNPEFHEILFIRESNVELETWFGHKLTKQEAQDISGIKNVMSMNRMNMVLREIIFSSKNIYFNSNEYPKFEVDYPSRDERFAKRLRKKYPNHEFERAAPIMADLRTIKSDIEIELLEKSCDITEKGFRRLLKYVKPGVKEYQVQAEIDHEFTMNSANGHGYPPIIASGLNACTLHYIENDKECKDGDLLLMDFGAEYANYTADLTRTIPVNGKFSKRQREVYESVLNVQKQAIKLLHIGNCIEKVNAAVNKFMEKEIVSLGLMKQSEANDPAIAKGILFNYFMHGTSHFLGLDVHDVGLKTEPFKAGMVFTCEPGLYIQDEKIGVRLENDILITENGPKDLTANIPIEADEIEALMAK